jgi:hypothetical protein
MKRKLVRGGLTLKACGGLHILRTILQLLAPQIRMTASPSVQFLNLDAETIQCALRFKGNRHTVGELRTTEA